SLVLVLLLVIVIVVVILVPVLVLILVFEVDVVLVQVFVVLDVVVFVAQGSRTHESSLVHCAFPPHVEPIAATPRAPEAPAGPRPRTRGPRSWPRRRGAPVRPW